MSIKYRIRGCASRQERVSECVDNEPNMCPYTIGLEMVCPYKRVQVEVGVHT